MASGASKYGNKMWTLCNNSSGYHCNYSLYSGQQGWSGVQALLLLCECYDIMLRFTFFSMTCFGWLTLQVCESSLTLEIPENGTLFTVPKSTVEYQIWHDQKLFFASRTSASVIKLRNVLGKIQKNTEKGLTGEILHFDPPNFDWIGNICQAKNFVFWDMTPTFDNFPNWPTY